MTKRCSRTLALLTATLFASACMADTGITGNSILSLLQSPTPANSFAAAMYIIGFNEGIAGAEAKSLMTTGTSGPKLYCIPENATNQQQIDIVKRYLIEHPAERHVGAGALIGIALERAWPCRSDH